MECVWDASLLRLGEQLPPELLQIIQNGSNERYLEAITEASLDPRYTYTLLVHCADLFPHICASLRIQGSFAACLATLGRVVPHASHLATFAIRLLENETYALNSSSDDDDDLQYLLGLLRLLRFNARIFRKFVRSHELVTWLGRTSRPATYLIIRILQIDLEAADHWLESTIKRYLGEDTSDGHIDGTWDEQIIDYRFLSLWEQDRYENVHNAMAEVRQSSSGSNPSLGSIRNILRDVFHPSTSLLAGVLLPRVDERQTPGPGQLVETDTVRSNLASVATALKSTSPTLLLGLAGSGKSLLIQHVARALGKLDKMVTLHLNEQSDAKLLLGVYTTGDTPGSFIWKPGVLTTAIQEGRWVFIEDLDRAPNEVLGTLLPIIEKRQLLIPNRKETVFAAEGFRIIATVRTTVNHRGEETKPLTHMVGYRHWNPISINMPTVVEQATIARSLFPKLERLMPQFIAVYERLSAARQTSMAQSKTGVARAITPRDLLKWCRRVSLLLDGRSSFTSHDEDAIYLEALDCFVGALPSDSLRTDLAGIAAEELRIDPQRRDYLLSAREVQYEADKAKIVIGRYSLPKSRVGKVAESSFSTNPHTTRMLERVTSAVLNREPLLLVGETGVGKTTAVQHLANHLGKKLVPFNLSQQSEAGDLLGGFKPVNARTLMVPMKDEFDDLFTEGFSSSKNKQFLELLGKQMARSNWKSVCKLFRQALGMVDQQRAVSPSRQGEAPAKKRKIDSKRPINFTRWDAFAQQLENIERKLSSGSDAFAFTFVEGNIVKALRNGDWALLDEINLASPDTLESIADLLDPQSPSLLLTEAGNIERVEAHPEFRVFAAMNPATDVGKKDLPPGIRSRFTELYVESPDKDLKSLQSIVRAYLRQEAVSDAAIASDVSHLYQKIIALAEQNKLVDGAGQRPHFSLRTLTRTLSYAKNIQQMCSLRRALYEGFHMSFMTFLDTESASLVQPLIEQHLFGKRVNVRAELQKGLRKPSDGRSHAQGYPGSKHWIRQGKEALQEQSHYIITPFVQSNLENLVRAASTRQFPVLIQGPTSSGKTSMIEYLAKRTGHVFTRINNHEHTDLQEYLGTYVSGTDGRLQFQEGVLVKALREGHWIVLDELNLAPTDVLEALNRLLDDNRELLVPETQEVIRPHSDFMLFATQNPAGLYGGRKTLSRAFRNRFLELHFDDIPVNELQEILHRRTQLPESRCKRIVTVYRELSVLRQENRLFEQKSFATLRDLFRWALRPNDTIEQLAANGFMLLCERVRKPEERFALKSVIEKVMSEKGPRVRLDEDVLYAQNSSEIQQHRQEANDRSVVWTRAMRRLYVLVSRAIANNEPVLLVGETGCGKTTVCQMLSDALKKDLHTVNAYQNTETSDLIGSQRPVRNRAAIEAELRQKLLASPALTTLSDSQSQPTDTLLKEYESAVTGLDKDEKAAWLQSPGHADITAAQVRFKALFEWVDGSLVNAMKTGDFFLLDEISLADDSVLERINSVLESQRTIMLAEKGSLDSFVSASPGFQLFATMNPGGDYGKRELSPALRNRFTEIWVPSLSDMDDVLQIVRAKLVQDAHTFASSMVAFAAWFKSRFDTSASSSVSIRDTLAWVEFVNAFAQQDVTAAVVHGAAMVYIDTLGANPAGLMSINIQGIQHERAACVDELCRLSKVDAKAIYSQSFEAVTTGQAFAIGPFKVPRTQNATATSVGFTFEPPTTRSNAMRVLRALQLRKPILLEGSPGVGKTALVTAVAGAAGMPLTRINLSDQTDLLDLFGSDAPVEGAQTGTFVWRDAPFLRAMKNGEWVLLDEMNLASQSVLEGLNACLDHRGEVFVPELGQTFARHPNFRLFAAQNPHHQGGGRKGLPSSFVNRFTVVYADSFKKEDLMLISRRIFPGLRVDYIAKTVSFVTKLNEEVAEQRRFGSTGGPWEFNLRDIARWLDLASARETLLRAGTPRDFATMLCGQRFRSVKDRSCVTTLFGSIFDESTAVADLFCGVTTQTLQVGLALLPRGEHWSATGSLPQDYSGRAPKHWRALQSMMLSIQRGWPVVLAGPPGVGKTTMIAHLAACTGADVVTLGMSSETDALDLIGGYEQFDPNRQSTQAYIAVRARLEALSKTCIAQGSLEAALSQLDSLQQLKSSPRGTAWLGKIDQSLPPETMSSLGPLLEVLQRGNQSIDKARFEWIDGPLIDALRQGKWLVLDNANLCSPSVLDRLNSLLEPNGSLIVNEHCGEDGAPRVIQPHANFRIFLTVDPRLGELSRAMRNRAVELYLDPTSPEVDSSTDGLFVESAMARLSALSAAGLAQRKLSKDSAARIAADHFALDDRVLTTRLLRQLNSGLLQSPAQETMALDFEDHTLPESQLRAYYSDISSQTQEPADFACVQTLHPLNNQPLVQQSHQSLSRAMTMAARHDLGTEFHAVVRILATLKADRKTSEKLTRFWRFVKQHVKGAGGSTSQWVPVESILHYTQAWIQDVTATSTIALAKTKTALRGLLAFVETLLRVLTSESLELASFTACVLVGQAMVTQSTSLQGNAQYLGQIQTAISDLVPKSYGNTGSGFVSLWKTLRIPMPATMDQLQALLDFESVVDRFDRMLSTSRLSLQRLVELRIAFQQALSVGVSAASNLKSLAEKLVASTPEINQKVDEEKVLLITPHFVQSFESMCQQFAVLSLEAPCMTQRDAVQLEVLALRKTSHGLYGDRSNSAQSKLRLLGLSVPTQQPEAEEKSGPEDICQSVLHCLKTVEDVSLQRMSLFEEESRALGHVVASKAHWMQADTLSTLDRCLRDLVRVILESLLEGGDTSAMHGHARVLLQSLQDNTDVQQPQSERIEATERLPLGLLQNVVRYLQTNSGKPEAAASAWTCFAIACLDIFIPALAFDPVQEAEFRRTVYFKAKDGLQSTLAALKAFREAWTGDHDSLRARLIEEDIAALGSEPNVIAICRPETSELSQLFGEFQALLRSLQPLKTSIAGALDFSAWNNVLVTRTRLSTQYRAYADLTSPVVGFIDCLAVARRLARRAEKDQIQSQFTSSASVTPFAGAALDDFLPEKKFIDLQQASTSREARLFWLSALAVRSTVVPTARSSQDLRSAITHTFRSFYEAWKVELSREQRHAAAKSSLFKYRGGDDDQDEVDQQELDELFPDHETTPTRSQDHDIQDLAPRMTELYHAIHSPDKAEANAFLPLLKEWATLYGHSSQSHKIPAVLSALHGLSTKLFSNHAPSRTANIYKDANIAQSRTLVALMNKLQSRFNSIHDAWPEHATPIEVLRGCDDILSLGHAEPLVRYLPSVEKLHATINEWQKVASTEFSANNLLEETTSLIIAWRQLELSTWAGMFNVEDENCKASAASWWYIAYETIIGASEELQGMAEEVQKFSSQLVETLGGFLANCGLGEYSIRLSMLADFEAALATQDGTDVIRGALSSLISFYSRFQPAITEQLHKKRAELEKAIKNVIQVASWKDRNIETLKNSAKASHKKLFRTVKKYRQLLSEPVGPILQAEFPKAVIAPESGTLTQLLPSLIAETNSESTVHSVLAAQFSDMQQNIREIQNTANSFNSPAATTKKIQNFLQDLDEESTELRKATPSTATEENKTLVQHLKTRKRRLLADVLRDVRLMGFQTNISEDVLAQQSSLHLVLAKSAPLGDVTADETFHRFLYVMQSVRENAGKHSEDLTPAEIARSKTLLESMLQVSLEQRQCLQRYFKDFTSLKTTMQQLAALANSESPGVRPDLERPLLFLQTEVTAVRSALQTAIRCIDIQAELSGSVYSTVADALIQEASRLDRIETNLANLPPIPVFIDNARVRELEAHFTSSKNLLRAVATDSIQKNPELEPVLSQLLNWIQHPTPSPTQANGVSATSDETWVQKFVGLLQQTGEQVKSLNFSHASGKDKKAWLLAEQKSTNSAIASMRLDCISDTLGKALERLHMDVHSNDKLAHIAASARETYPILQAYADVTGRLISEMCDLHTMTCRMAHRLALSFVQLAKEGFCQPPEKAQGDQKESGQVESGTGLGNGEGAEDISKDVGDDEDLGDLAQDANSKEKEEETQAEKDAVDMADEELEGEFDESTDADEEEGGDEDGQEDAEVDEEAGKVDEKDGATDEKTWDDGKAEEAEKEADKGKGTRSEDVSAAQDGANEEDEQEAEDGEQGDDDAEMGAEVEDEGEAQAPEQADPHLQDEQNLDLPEDMNMDGGKAEDEDMDSGDDLGDAFSEADADADVDATSPDAKDAEMQDGEEEDRGEENGEAVDLDKEEADEAAEQDGEDANSDVNMLDMPDNHDEPDDGLTTADAGQGNEEDKAAKSSGALSNEQEMQDENDAEQDNGQPGTAEGQKRSEQNDASGQVEVGADEQEAQPFQQLGDLLKQWYEQHRDIEAAKQDNEAEPESQQQMDMQDTRFEHTEDVDAEMQAIGAASADQSRALDNQNAVPIDNEEPEPTEKLDNALPPDPEDQPADDNVEAGGATDRGTEAASKPDKAMIGAPNNHDMDIEDVPRSESPQTDMEDVDEQLTNTHLSLQQPNLMSLEDARHLWTEHESRTRNMAVVLTEHLRLILQPTQATKMRGDFRTGKRLNIKKIIPYIASSYKRDKIWMRRSIPSKRSYQIMLAIDDSESMNESERKGLAFDTLALVAKSMSMLEVGELCIIGFGETINVNHDFSAPFTSEAGAEVFKQFSFSQTKTDVRRLLEKSIDLFRTARLKATGSASDLWQLQLIISDGLCEDHPSIRQLVRQAHEEQIMVVFIVVDATAEETKAVGPKQSIVDLQRVEFTKDATGEPQINMIKYLDTFPFKYYLIVRDVVELPGVLAGALRQWFSEVVESGG
ncbi:hypothetical protein M409DRAFT_17936 [Zasmidium cellare ATCC 36951]|uniref:Midasin n=1 Tax=Zasmidium cellare ATCC 36951 TaxID=1080233 RepID=A0A6A6D0T6_ZASCE|nr:uncharacterized protein M409DRAFT_17936 [Zasmidium cellare ATCC 36951]KAF2171699.1 hypothetical protein M409DRAFT_17936 [Zasmidium cellare ATCC 36951]